MYSYEAVGGDYKIKNQYSDRKHNVSGTKQIQRNNNDHIHHAEADNTVTTPGKKKATPFYKRITFIEFDKRKALIGYLENNYRSS